MKRYITLIAAVALVACSNEELSTPENNMATSEAPVNFEVYTQRGLTRAGTPNDITNSNIGGIGFGVFAYYTAGAQYDQKATPNFMYNEHVTKNGTAWTYEPVKYWPNEFGSDAKSAEVDRVSFFAYAPWTEVDPTTGNVAGTTVNEQNCNIVAVNKFSATGDPLIKYVVDTDPATSVDLLWGVAAENAGDKYQPITNLGQAPQVEEGKPFIDLVKPAKPADDCMSFNLKHALAKVKVTIDYIDDANTPAGQSETIYPEETRIYVRSFKISGFALKGALNLNNTIAGQPLWKEFDGVKDLAFDDIIFQDGRKDGKEGETNGAQPNETPQGLNPQIVENFCLTTTDGNGNTVFGATKTPGVTATPTRLFEGTADGYFYIIPRNGGSGVDIEIAYDVETIDQKLVGKLSDNETHGISIENVISKEKIFGDAVDFEPGKVYEIKIHLGMTSAKVDATVTPWEDNGSTNVNLPDNQGGNNGSGTGGNGGNNMTANEMINSAFSYQYTPAWTYGAYSVNDNEITYTLNTFTSPQEFAAATNKMMNDLARFLGGLYRGTANVQKIVYKGDEYIWNTSGTNTGSNWVKNVDQMTPTLVNVITTEVTNEYQTTPLTTKTLTITADDKDIKFTFNIPQNAVPVGNEGDEAIQGGLEFNDLNVYANQYSTTPLGTSGGIVSGKDNTRISLHITSGYRASAYDDYYIQPNAVYNPHIAYRYPVYTNNTLTGNPAFWIEW